LETLHQMVHHVPVKLSIAALLKCAGQRKAAGRARALELMALLFSTRSRDVKRYKGILPSALAQLPKMLSDPNLEAKAMARSLIRVLLQCDIATREELGQYVTPEAIDKSVR